jgi:expansin (peptidoglycan-binding protein)
MSQHLRDTLERAAWAFIEGAVSGVVVTQLTDQSMWWAAVSAGVTPALSVLKSSAATRVGFPESASLSKKI